jgi:acetylornithine deacetylase
MSMLPTLERTLREMVAMDTTSSRSNVPFIDYLEARLRPAGFACERLRYVDEAGVEKVNLLARKGGAPGELPALALVGHTDCVPYDAAWKEALVLTGGAGRLYGRGACDTKAFITCALEAACRAQSLSQPLLLVFTADEEVGCIGAKRLVQAGAGQARHAIVGEPTSLVPIRANKGYGLAEVEVRGIEGHSAYPETGASAIIRAARLLQRLDEQVRTTLRAEVDTAFEPPYTTVNVGLISGGKAKNVIPGSCRFTLEWRPIPGQRVEHVPELVQALVGQLVAEEQGFEAEVRVLRQDRGVATPESAAVVQFLANQSGKTPSTVAFGTEAPQLTALGAEAVVFGPGDIRNAHKTGEFVPVDELVRCEEILSRAISHFCTA